MVVANYYQNVLLVHGGHKEEWAHARGNPKRQTRAVVQEDLMPNSTSIDEDAQPLCLRLDASNAYANFLRHCPSRRAVDGLIAKSNGTKSAFFHLLGEAFPLTKKYTDSGFRIRSKVKACFLGDSLLRELSFLWDRVAPMASGEWRPTSCNWLRGWDKKSFNIAKGRLDWIRTSDCGILFAGGLGPHCLRRPAGGPPEGFPVPPPISPRAHAKYAENFMRDLEDVAVQTGIPTVFVGSPIVEGDILLLNPSKNDWDEFHDFSLTKLWSYGEAAVFEQLFGQNNEKVRRDINGTLHFFNAGDFYAKCPGFRCDGMHSNTKSLDRATNSACKQNPGFLDFPFFSFLERSGLANAISSATAPEEPLWALPTSEPCCGCQAEYMASSQRLLNITI